MLALKIKDITFKNPIMVASGTYGYGNEVSDFVNLSKFGAIITKSAVSYTHLTLPTKRIV